MNTLFFTIKLLSDAVPASGITTSVIIDSDVAADENGLPYIPAKRIKGLLLESLLEVSEITDTKNEGEIRSLFGVIGNAVSHSIHMTDANIQHYETYDKWLSWAESKYMGEFQPDRITDVFTSIRRQTKLNNGIAEDHSLRSSRVLNKDLKFNGVISKNNDFSKKEIALLTLAFSNLRTFGVNRNRGFGRIDCVLSDSDKCPIDLRESYKEVIS